MNEKAPTITPKQFQRTMIEIVSEQIDEEFAKEDKSSRKEIHIVSPTGSGKTFMMRQTLETFLETKPNENIVFLWISTSTGGLLEQSYQTFKETFKGSTKFSILKIEELIKDTDKGNKIVFTSWENINSKATNKIYRQHEHQNEGLEEFLSNNSDVKFIGVIDESHRNVGDKDSKSSIAYDLFNCELTIYLTATPTLPEVNDFKDKVNKGEITNNVKNDLIDKWIYVVPEQDVVDSHLITEETLYNIRPNEESYFEPTTELDSIELGLERLEQLKKVSHRYNPLMLIQLSNESEENKKIKTEKLPQIEEKLNKKGIKYLIWLNKDNDNKTKFLLTESQKNEIKKDNSDIGVLIFKQAVAVGWDCPRAKILVKERDTKSKTFDEQVLGRIRRIPGGDHSLDHPHLKYSYVYSHHIKNLNNPNPTKLGEFEKTPLMEDIQNFEEKPFSIPVFSQRIESELYYDKMLNELKNYNFNGFNLNKETHISKIISGREKTYSGHIEESDSLNIKESISGIKNKVFYNVLKINHHFDKGVSPLLIIQLLHDFFSEKFGSQSYEETYTLIANNQALIDKCLTELFKKLIQEIYRPKLNDESYYQDYQLPEFLIYNTDTKDNDLEVALSTKGDFLLSRYIYQKPVVVDKIQSTEKIFIEKLNRKAKHSKIKYWFKNSTKSDSFFMMRSDGKRFFPDFLIQLEDGTIWIYEIKAYGDENIENDEEMKMKKEALDLYLKFAQSNGYEIYGEIISSKDDEWFKWGENGNWELYELFPKTK